MPVLGPPPPAPTSTTLNHPDHRTMKSSFAAIAMVSLAGLIGSSAAQCYDNYKLYEILASPNGEMDIVDGFGARGLKAEIVDLNNCDDWPTYPTGLETPSLGGGNSGLTTISMQGPTAAGQTDGSNGWCRINNSTSGGKTSHWWPIRAIKVTAMDGWKIQPSGITVSDVDMEGHVTVEESLRKAALVFGFNGNDIVNATWDLTGSSLITHGMKIEDPALGNLGFTRAAGVFEWMTGVMTTYGDRSPQVSLLRCDQGAATPACAATASFDVPIDGFYVMANMEWKSDHQGDAFISIGDLNMKCGCRCDQRSGTRTVTVPTADPTRCTQKSSTGTMAVCNPTGADWCERTDFTRWAVTGPLDTVTNTYPCAASPGMGAKYAWAITP